MTISYYLNMSFDALLKLNTIFEFKHINEMSDYIILISKLK